jgi:hypothetical protein
MFVPRYTENEAREAVASSLCYSEALRKLGLRPVGGNHRVFRRYVDEIWGIATGHFDPTGGRRTRVNLVGPTPLEDVLVVDSEYDRKALKRRLYESGIKARRCELCGQGEDWRGRHMSLILDHINGVPNDNRLENLRIVCPNCAATLSTHCGRKNVRAKRQCARCGRPFQPGRSNQTYCSRECGTRHGRRDRGPHPETRKVERPSHEQLLADLKEMSFLAVGRKYGVSDNAIHKWLRWYENEAERTAREADAGDDRLDEAA